MTQTDLASGYAAAAVERISSVDAPRRRVLVVDDEEGVRGVVARVLEKAGYDVVEAEDGQGALALLDVQGGFSAAVVDLTMPGLRGDAVVHAMRQHAPGMRVILMSGYREEEAIPEGEPRPDAFLRKPFLPDDLRRVMRAVLA